MQQGFNIALIQKQIMYENVKSTLVVARSSKKEPEKKSASPQDIEYKQVANSDDFIGELSDEEKEAQFNRQHEQYIKMKLQRKQDLLRIKRQEFGSSSSEDEHPQSSDDEIEELKNVKKIDSKRSRGKLDKKQEIKSEPNHFPVFLELKKSTTEADLILLQKEFQINKKVLAYAKISRMSLATVAQNGQLVQKLRIGIGSDQDILLSPLDKEKPSLKMVDLFMKLLRIRINLMSIKFTQQGSRCNLEDFGQLSEGALIYDKIYKKSQIIGTWEERYVVIKPDGLYSYRTLKSKPTMFIPLKEITEVYTQFELYKQQFVMKLFYNGTKTDFGLPLDAKLEWVLRFVSLTAIE